MKFASAYSGLALAGLVSAAAVHKEAHQLDKRALQVVTVTDVVWEVVTITEYDNTVATTVVAQAPAAAVTTTNTASAALGTPVAKTPSTTAVVESNVAVVAASTPAIASTTSSAVAAGNVAVASTTSVAAAATTAASSTSSTYSGDATYYELGLTACGETYTDSDYVAAISYKLFDQDGTANPNNNPHCGKKIRVYRNSASVDVTIVDRCAGCEGTYDVDLSPTAFQVLATESEGRVAITWNYI